jgi:hypothetical protein
MDINVIRLVYSTTREWPSSIAPCIVFFECSPSPKKMDAYVISIILSYTPYDLYNLVRLSLGDHLSSKDQETLFDIDIKCIPANYIEGYLLSLGSVSKDRMEMIYNSASRNKIFITAITFKSLRKSSYVYYYESLKAKMMKDRLGWLRGNPFPSAVSDGMSIKQFLPNVSIDMIPHLSYTIKQAYTYSGYRFINLLNVYKRARVPLGELPSKYATGGVCDEYFAVYCECVRRGLWCDTLPSPELVKRLILAMPERVYKHLRARTSDACEMYILSHSPDGTINGAPDELIVKAYRLSKMDGG